MRMEEIVMNDLFRFLLSRPAEPSEPEDVNSLTASFASQGAPSAGLMEPVRGYVANNLARRAHVPGRGTCGDRRHRRGLDVVEDLLALVKMRTGKRPAGLVGDAATTASVCKSTLLQGASVNPAVVRKQLEEWHKQMGSRFNDR
jgi:hypothetical protein